MIFKLKFKSIAFFEHPLKLTKEKPGTKAGFPARSHTALTKMDFDRTLSFSRHCAMILLSGIEKFY